MFFSYVVVRSFNPLVIYMYEEGMARFATVKKPQITPSLSNAQTNLIILITIYLLEKIRQRGSEKCLFSSHKHFYKQVFALT